jgi:hypothetical protein
MTDRRNTRWTPKDENDLLDGLKENLDILSIAERLGRTDRGIRSHRNHMARHLVLKGIPIEEVSKTVRMDVDEINKSLRMSQLSTEANKRRREAKQNDNNI